MDTEAEILVVGAGPTGLLLAAELRRRAVDCLLIDIHEKPLSWDRATVVHPRSIEIFDSLGIADPLLKAGVRQRFARIHSNGTRLGDVDLSLCGSRYPFNLGVSEEVTEAILTDYLARFGGVVRRSTRLVGLEKSPDGVLATVERDGEKTQILAQWVVGCDGYWSTVRTLVAIEQDGHDIEEPWAVFDAAIRGWPYSYEAIYAFLDETPIILTALPDRRWRVYLRPTAEGSDLVADASATLLRYSPGVAFEDIANPTRFHCHSKVARQYRCGRVLLAGDAAHACSPVQGHGMNSGLQDAFNLAWKLALVSSGDGGETLLDSYDAERRPVAQMIIASGDEADGAQMVKDSNARRTRDANIRAAFIDPASRHHEAVAEAELDIDYADSPVVLGERNDFIWPGQRLPDGVEVEHATGGAGMLHEYANRRGHTAFLIGGASATQQELARVRRDLEPVSNETIIETTIVLTANSSVLECDARLTPATAERLGVDAITLLIVRPDGHLGLCADRSHAGRLAAYIDLLRASQAEEESR
ncbi:MAG: FAD-dependent monooxygenase [Methylocystis sp.]|uniref:FAD-dependent monooxygenase n=1 Tax=Methylocystis sp. TaxID=1911079 RepID=UPI003D0B1934